MRREWLIFVIIPCVIVTSSLSASADRLSVYVVNYPLKYFAERIAGEHATVILPVPAGNDPAFWRVGQVLGRRTLQAQQGLIIRPQGL